RAAGDKRGARPAGKQKMRGSRNSWQTPRGHGSALTVFDGGSEPMTEAGGAVGIEMDQVRKVGVGQTDVVVRWSQQRNIPISCDFRESCSISGELRAIEAAVQVGGDGQVHEPD